MQGRLRAGRASQSPQGWCEGQGPGSRRPAEACHRGLQPRTRPPQRDAEPPARFGPRLWLLFEPRARGRWAAVAPGSGLWLLITHNVPTAVNSLLSIFFMSILMGRWGRVIRLNLQTVIWRRCSRRWRRTQGRGRGRAAREARVRPARPQSGRAGHRTPHARNHAPPVGPARVAEGRWPAQGQSHRVTLRRSKEPT